MTLQPDSETTYDVIVAGVGGMGSATAFHLANRGIDVLGLEQYEIPHRRGSSHGQSRLIRLAYAKDPAYVPLVKRAYSLWEDLQTRVDRQLLYKTGTITGGAPDSSKFRGAMEAARTHGLEHETLSGTEINDRFDGYRMPSEFEFVYQPDSGFLFPEACIESYAGLAVNAGAELHTDEPVTDWDARDRGVVVTTDRGSYHADRLILTAGSWLGELAGDFESTAIPERQVLAWFETKTDNFQPDTFPPFDIEFPEGKYYGTPEFNVPGFKLGRFRHRRETATPDDVTDATAEDEAVLRTCAEQYFPAGAGECLNLETCLFTNTPDGHFIVDRHPAHENVYVGGGFSGHGFKFASVIGEVFADLALDGETSHDIDLFAATRFE
jgi:sarcosine oxidase